ncbi:uncharacterized protein NEMAJ01_2383 [Nematocida major]|uniref:uncharacterized protein n=1 Tax=Nematocida major TaxID=1912982 RepID=UPI0020073740|nr:uncharacterized protein NEMAJ01_2383 [Nematocida major]KAH9387487.1 hypothetical protein NEMAJ01_2383 [Nematocida major]
MQNLFVCETLKSASLLVLPGGVGLYEWTGDLLRVAGSPQKKEVRMEEKKLEDNVYIAEKSGTKITIYGHIQAYLVPVLSDFYIPMHMESVEFYGKMQEMLGGSVAAGIETYFNEYIRENSVPFYPVPLTTLSGVFRYYNFKEFKSARSKTQLVQKIRVDEEAPEANPRTEEVVRRQLGSQYGRFKEGLLRAFEDRAVWPIKGLEKYFASNEEVFQSWKWSSVKNILPCIAYTYSTGPWKKLWIRYGYSPVKDPGAYKYQVYVWKNISKAFVIMDKPEIYQKIRETPEFTKDVFDARTGFLTESAMRYMHTKFSEVKVPEPERVEGARDLFDNLDFTTLDD